jgi:hypothetical protein
MTIELWKLHTYWHSVLVSCCQGCDAIDWSVCQSSFFLSSLMKVVDAQVYQLSIRAACGLSWPSDRIIVQVLDDSTDPDVKVKDKCSSGGAQGPFPWTLTTITPAASSLLILRHFV